MTHSEGPEDKKQLKCSFCKKGQHQVRKLIAGPGVNICIDCVEMAREISYEDDKKEQEEKGDMGILTPKKLVERLNEYVIGQERSKKALGNACYDHMIRVSLTETTDEEIDKSNIAIIGPSGSGKTEIFRALRKIYPDLPIAIADATSLTEAGYVGDDAENILLKLIQEAGYDVAKAEKGIIYLDEFDKLARKGDSPSLTRDVSGEGVQQALLKIIEGNIVSVPMQGGRKHPREEMIQIDTTNILFVLGGAFDGLEEIVKKRMNQQTIGFDNKRLHAKDTDWYQFVQVEDLKAYGIIPELLGRLPILTSLSPLTEEQLIEVLTVPKNSIVKQKEIRFEQDGQILEFEEGVFSLIAQEAHKKGTGARGLRSIMESLLLEVKYQFSGCPGIKIRITEKYFHSRDINDVVVVHKMHEEMA